MKTKKLKRKIAEAERELAAVRDEVIFEMEVVQDRLIELIGAYASGGAPIGNTSFPEGFDPVSEYFAMPEYLLDAHGCGPLSSNDNSQNYTLARDKLAKLNAKLEALQ